MMYWWFIFWSDLLIPIMMIVIGRLMWKHPPKNINALIGYRTTRSMKNMDTWNFAHHYSGKLWWKIGWMILLPSLLVHIPFYKASEDVVGIVCVVLLSIQVIILIFSIFPVERALKKTFTDEGVYR